MRPQCWFPQRLHLGQQARCLLARRLLRVRHPADQLRHAAVGPLAVLPQRGHLCGRRVEGETWVGRKGWAGCDASMGAASKRSTAAHARASRREAGCMGRAAALREPRGPAQQPHLPQACPALPPAAWAALRPAPQLPLLRRPPHWRARRRRLRWRARQRWHCWAAGSPAGAGPAMEGIRSPPLQTVAEQKPVQHASGPWLPCWPRRRAAWPARPCPACMLVPAMRAGRAVPHPGAPAESLRPCRPPPLLHKADV